MTKHQSITPEAVSVRFPPPPPGQGEKDALWTVSFVARLPPKTAPLGPLHHQKRPRHHFNRSAPVFFKDQHPLHACLCANVQMEDPRQFRPRPFGAFPNFPAQWVPFHQPSLPKDGYADSWVISFVIAYQFRDPERVNWRLGAPIRTCLRCQDNPLAPPTFRIIWTRDEPPATRNNLLRIIKRLWGGIIHAGAREVAPAILDGMWSWDPKRGRLVVTVLLPKGTSPQGIGSERRHGRYNGQEISTVAQGTIPLLPLNDFGPLVDMAHGVLRPWVIQGAIAYSKQFWEFILPHAIHPTDQRDLKNFVGYFEQGRTRWAYPDAADGILTAYEVMAERTEVPAWTVQASSRSNFPRQVPDGRRTIRAARNA